MDVKSQVIHHPSIFIVELGVLQFVTYENKINIFFINTAYERSDIHLIQCFSEIV